LSREFETVDVERVAVGETGLALRARNQIGQVRLLRVVGDELLERVGESGVVIESLLRVSQQLQALFGRRAAHLLGLGDPGLDLACDAGKVA
jgi:hypothetical protein